MKNLLNQKGQSTVEFSFVLIIATFLIAGLASVAQIGYHWAVMHYAASEAARFGSLGLTDPSFKTHEDSIRNRVVQIAHGLGVDGIAVEFTDQSQGASAGKASEYFVLRLSRPLDLDPAILTLFGMNRGASIASRYQLIVRTVIRNEPF